MINKVAFCDGLDRWYKSMYNKNCNNFYYKISLFLDHNVAKALRFSGDGVCESQNQQIRRFIGWGVVYSTVKVTLAISNPNNRRFTIRILDYNVAKALRFSEVINARAKKPPFQVAFVAWCDSCSYAFMMHSYKPLWSKWKFN
jgi:hypothetical protein